MNPVRLEEVIMRSPQRCPCQQSVKRQCLTSVESRIYHHPLFNEVDVTAANVELVTIHVLNDESLDFILSYFNITETFRLSLVCRRWYNLCLLKISRIARFSVKGLQMQLGIDPILNVLYPNFRIENVMSILSVNCGSLTTLSLCNVVGLNAVCLSYLNDFLPNLVNLKLGGEFLSDDTILAAIREKLAPRMESIHMDGRHYAINKNILSNVLKNANRLVHLSISHFGGSESQDGLSIILPDVLSSANPITSVEFKFSMLHVSILEFIMENFAATLDYLNISRNYSLSLNNITIKSLPRLNNMKIFLAHVDQAYYSISKPSTCSANQMISVLKLMPKLRVLDLTGNCYLTFSGIDVVGLLLNHCVLLEELHLTNCWIPPDKLEKLKEIKFLKRLRLDYNLPKYNMMNSLPEYDSVLIFLCFASKVLPHLKELEYVSMYGVEFKEDDLVLFIGNAGPNFKGLFLSATFLIPFFEDDPEDSDDSDDPTGVGYNHFEEALKKCNSLVRSEPITLFIRCLYRLHMNTCKDSYHLSGKCSCSEDCASFYNEISPNFLRILKTTYHYTDDVDPNFINHFASGNGHLSHSYSQYIKFPCFNF